MLKALRALVPVLGLLCAVPAFSVSPNIVISQVYGGAGCGTAGCSTYLSTLPNLTINDVSLNEGNAGTTSFTFTVSLSAPAGPGGVTFDITTADNTATQPGDYTLQSLTAQTIPSGSSTYSFTVLVNGDTSPETNETFFVNVTNVTGANTTDGQGQGTIVNDDITRIHDVQGSGAATPIPGSTVTVEGVVVANFQGTGKLAGFFLEEEDADYDADPATSEGIFIFCNTCPTAVAEGQLVRVTGTVSEFNNMTEITASTAPAVVITNAGNNLASVTPAPIDLPIAGVVNDFYEAREGMKVTFVDTLSVAEYFELGRYGQIILYEGGRPRQFTEANAPSVAGNAAQADNLSRREVILDDDNNAQQWYLTTSTPAGPADGFQFVFHPRANGGFSTGTQGTDFFRGGDLVNGLTGVLHWSFAGQTGTDAWRIRPASANPATFTVANPRPATPPTVGGAIKVAGMNLLNYFTTIDTTSSNSSGPCGPSLTQDCRGADSAAELNRQRERASIVICTLNADVYGFAELENTTASASITDLLGAVNARCGGTHPYAFVNTGGTLGTDAIRVQEIYRTGIVSPVGSPLSDLDPVHNRPPTAQTFDVVDATNPAFGQRFTVIVNHFKSKGCPGTGGDADTGDGQGCFNATRTAQATRLLTWISGTVLPAAGDPDVLLLGDFNAYAKEDPITTLAAGGFNDLETTFHGANAYSYLFDGQLGHLDYGFANAALLSQVTGADAWHINADEVPLFDYNDEVKDTGESTFEEKPDGSALVPPRVVFQAASPYRASDHDPVLLGLFQIADVSITKTLTTSGPYFAGQSITYTLDVANAGPDPATNVQVTDTPTNLSITSVSGSGCAALPCTIPSLNVGSTSITVTATIVAAGAFDNSATATGAESDPNTANNTDNTLNGGTAAASANVSISKNLDTAGPYFAGQSVTYTITVANAGPSTATNINVTETPANLTITSVTGACASLPCSIASILPTANSVITVTATINAAGAFDNSASANGAESDPAPANNTDNTLNGGTAAASANVSISKNLDTAGPYFAGQSVTYTITVANAGPSTATNINVTETPANLTITSVSGACASLPCSIASILPTANSVITVTATINAAGAFDNSATATGAEPDPNTANNTDNTLNGGTAAASANVSISKTLDTAGPYFAGQSVTYTITVANAGPSPATNINVTDTPANLTITGVSGACVTLPCAIAAIASGANTSITVTATITSAGAFDNSATATGAEADPNLSDNTDSTLNGDSTTGGATLTATKTAAGSFQPGSNVTYTIIISNSGPSSQADNPGDELVDVLQSELNLVSATETSGDAVANIGTNTVTWNGSIPAGGSVTVTIVATIDINTAPGTIINNYATINYDTDGDGDHDATAETDDPGQPGGSDDTGFAVAAVPAIAAIPTLDELALLALAALLAMVALAIMKR